MIDERRLYIGQLLRNYKNRESPYIYTVNYRFPDDREDRYKLVDHNYGIDLAIDYIRELESKLDELQYVERIIQAARRSDYGY